MTYECFPLVYIWTASKESRTDYNEQPSVQHPPTHLEHLNRSNTIEKERRNEGQTKKLNNTRNNEVCKKINTVGQGFESALGQHQNGHYTGHSWVPIWLVVFCV